MSESDVGAVKRGFWAKLRKHAGKVPFVRDAIASYYCMLDAATPLWVKGILAGALVYFISPVDAIPDVIPVLGFTDDATVLTGAIAAVGAHLKPEHYKPMD